MVALILSLCGCLDDPAVNVKALSKPDQVIVAAAAAMQGVGVSNRGFPWEWQVTYGGAGNSRGKASRGFLDLCHIHISNHLNPCRVGGRDQRLFITARHEIRHCVNDSSAHSDNPWSFMFEDSPCWPDD